MKKSQALGLSVVALTGSMSLMMPQTASAVVGCGTAITTSTATQTCSGSGGYTQENVDFTGSKGVAMTVTDSTTDFSNCGWHVNGGKSFGMSTGSTTMTVLAGTGKTVTSGIGCV